MKMVCEGPARATRQVEEGRAEEVIEGERVQEAPSDEGTG